MNALLDGPLAATLVAVITGVALVMIYGNWREGLLFVLVIGVLQDVMRKLTDGAPPLYIIWTAAIFGLVGLRAWQYRLVSRINALFLADAGVKKCWIFLAVVMVAQLFNSLIRWGPVVPVLGMVEYVVPLAAVTVGIGYAERPEYILRFLKRYVKILAPVALTIYLSIFFSEDLDILKDIGAFTGTTLVITDFDVVIEPYAGLMRTGEIAAWHAATAAMFVLILSQHSRKGWQRAATTILIALLIGAIFYTGRRKMLLALTIFPVTYCCTLFFFRQRFANVLKIVGGVLVMGAIAVLVNEFVGGTDQSAHLRRGASVFSSAGDRADATVWFLGDALEKSGFLGLGIGVYAQGSRYAGVDLDSVVGAGGEAGVGKILLELGVPGAVALILVLVASLKRVTEMVRGMGIRRDPMTSIACGLLSFFVTQVATFSVATQLFGDPFVLIVIGITGGIFLSILLHGVVVAPAPAPVVGQVRVAR